MFDRLKSTQAIVMLATLTAIGYALSWLDFAIFPAASFLKLDFSTFATLFGGYMYGPVGVVVIEGIKQLLLVPTSSTAGVGQLANFIVNTCFALVPSVLYCYKKGIRWVIVGMILGCVVQIAVSLPCNRYINFPLFTSAPEAMFASLWGYILAFNAIKSVAVSLLVFLLYKRLSFLIKKYVPGGKRNKADAPAPVSPGEKAGADNGGAAERSARDGK